MRTAAFSQGAAGTTELVAAPGAQTRILVTGFSFALSAAGTAKFRTGGASAASTSRKTIASTSKTIAQREHELDELTGRYADFLHAWEGRVAEEIKRLDEIAARGGFEARLARVEDALANRLGVGLGAEQ
jgi:hypothetical protein